MMRSPVGAPGNRSENLGDPAGMRVGRTRTRRPPPGGARRQPRVDVAGRRIGSIEGGDRARTPIEVQDGNGRPVGEKARVRDPRTTSQGLAM